MYRDSSIAPLLDLRRRVEAVMDVLGSMIRSGVSLARSVELTRAGPVHPITWEDFLSVQVAGIGKFFRLAEDLRGRLSDFVR